MEKLYPWLAMSEKFQPGTLISGWNRRHLKETQLVPLKRKEKLKPNKCFMYLSPADKLSTQSAEQEKRKQLFQGNCCCNEFKCCCNEFKLPINTFKFLFSCPFYPSGISTKSIFPLLLSPRRATFHKDFRTLFG